MHAQVVLVYLQQFRCNSVLKLAPSKPKITKKFTPYLGGSRSLMLVP